jgi:hypothetical protein
MTKYEDRLKALVYVEFEKELQRNLENDNKIKYYNNLFNNRWRVRDMVCLIEDIELKDILLSFIHGVDNNYRKCESQICGLEYEVKTLKEKLEKLTP